MMMYGCKMLLSIAVTQDSNVLAEENKFLSDARDEEDTSSLLFRMTVLGIPAFCARILSWGSLTSAWG